MADHIKRPNPFKGKPLTAERLREMLSYESLTGILIWAKFPSGGRKAGDIAGSIHRSTGYRRVRIDKRDYLAHRLIWLWFYGKWPSDEIDHINGDRSDNRFCNLRAATASQNRCNTKLLKRNSAGLKGAHRIKKSNRWGSSIRANGITHHLGTFTTAEEAHSTYVEAAKRMFGEFARY
jgi:hypothetical protein